MKTILCIKWGTRYGPEYVNRIHAMVERNITPPFQVVCFTDDMQGIRKEVRCFDLPELGCPVPTNAPGKWSKVRLWSRELHDLKGPALFVDLDVVITGDLDPLFSHGNPDDVILARNWVKPLERLGQTSVFRFPIGGHAYLLEDFRKDPEGIAGRYQFEQRYVTRHVRGGIKFWPRGWVSHFRMDCLGPWPLRYLRPPRLPRNTRIVIFPGVPDPSDAILGRWNPREVHRTRWEHLKHTWSPDRVNKSWFKHIKHYVLPAAWISEHWRE